jgi:leucyl-tRNA---protein transferase
MTGTPGTDLVFINEAFDADAVSPAQLDLLLTDGWRHFGTHFFRYNLNLYREEIRRVIPLRIRLADFRLSKSQRRVLKKNADLAVTFTPASLTDEIHELFHRHKGRFDHGVPDSIYNFLSDDAANSPVECFQIVARDNDAQLLAVSFFDVGETSVSAIYALFDPEITNRSLGIFTMLKVIDHAAALGKTFYYQGYAYEGESFYDYKKRFSGTEAFDWNGNWEKFSHRGHRE